MDIGNVGHHSNGGVLAHSKFGRELESNSLSFPEPGPLPGTTQPNYPTLLLETRPFLFVPTCYGHIPEETYLVCVYACVCVVFRLCSHNNTYFESYYIGQSCVQLQVV